MFLDKLLTKNRAAVEAALELHKRGAIEPDSYIIDLDSVRKNAESISQRAKELGIKLYFMTKQIGRNPLVAASLLDYPAFQGAVAVDFREAETLYKNRIPVSHVGHLVQPPVSLIKKFIERDTEVITVYSLEMAQKIGDIAHSLGKVQPLLLRLWRERDALYPMQEGGFPVDNVESIAKEVEKLPGVSVEGVTGFPSFLYSEERGEVELTANGEAAIEGFNRLKKAGFEVKQLNLPSNTNEDVLNIIAENGGTHGEPGHSLTGTTPDRKSPNSSGTPAMFYLSEVSHNFEGRAYAYGGGMYSRSRMEKGYLLGETVRATSVPNVIDYHFYLEREAPVGAPVILSFRSQIFTARSQVVVLEGVERGLPQIKGVYTSLGEKVL